MTTTTLLAIVLGIAFVSGGGFALRDVRASRSRRARAVPATGVAVDLVVGLVGVLAGALVLGGDVVLHLVV
jgi:hypothetical protein